MLIRINQITKRILEHILEGGKEVSPEKISGKGPSQADPRWKSAWRVGHKTSVAKVMDRECEWRDMGALMLEQSILEAFVAIGGALAFIGGEWEH